MASTGLIKQIAGRCIGDGCFKNKTDPPTVLSNRPYTMFDRLKLNTRVPTKNDYDNVHVSQYEPADALYNRDISDYTISPKLRSPNVNKKPIVNSVRKK